MKTLCWLLGVMCLATSSVEAGHRQRCCDPVPVVCAPAPTCAPCGAVCTPPPSPTCAPAMVEKTILVPEMTTETRKVSVVEYKSETREEITKVQRMVPKTETRSRDVQYFERQEVVKDIQVTFKRPVMKTVDVTYTVCIPETITKEGVRKVCKPVWVDVEREFTTMVPNTEARKGTRNVWKCVPVVKKSVICEDKGQWVEQPAPAPACGACAPINCCAPAVACGCAAPCNSACGQSCVPASRMVWVPNIVQREVEVTVHEMQCGTEEFDYNVTLCKPEIQKRLVKVCKMEVFEEKYNWQETTYRKENRVCQKQVCDWEDVTETRQVKECVMVPKTKTENFNVTTYECVTEDVKKQVQVCVPVTVEKDISVQVCKMVEKKIMVPAPAACCAPATCAPAAACCQ